MPDWYVDENKWRSARYGMDAILITGSDGEEELVSDTVAQMVEQLMPVAEELGGVRELVAIQTTLDAGASYQRQLAAVSAAGGANQAAVKLMQAEGRAGRPLSPTEVLSTASTIHPSTLPASHRHRFASA
ncbi:MAG: hypothetical protein Q605_AUC00971G0004 [Actinomyces urogenitalis DORA_12]|uniref:Uncharacterized protein n=1 Tax=Actinomyces urogenitalis DORA_12 TaxID=1403939 RepID=W1VCN4_9ACTO|nr:MAG: hypothetical protein Q605_AUC00971G0004 [Actinomyces urogenitalis DORA_12]